MVCKNQHPHGHLIATAIKIHPASLNWFMPFIIFFCHKCTVTVVYADIKHGQS